MEAEPSSLRGADAFDAEADAWWSIARSTAEELRGDRHVPAGAAARPGDLGSWFEPALWRDGAPAGRLRAAVRQAMVAAEADEICASRRDEVDWAGVVPWLDEEGLHFEVSESGRRLLQCANDYLLSFGAARPFIAPARLDAFDAVARGTFRVGG